MKPQKLIHIISGFILISPVMVYAGDIQPLHHAIYAGNAENWPKPTGAGSPTGTGTSLNVAHGGSGSLAAGMTKDQLRFTCPAGTKCFGVNIRDKSPNTTTNVRAGHLPGLTPTISDNTGGNLAWGEVAFKNNAAGATTWDVQVDKTGGTAALQYELHVDCYKGLNETAPVSQPSSAVYLLNQ